MIKNRLLRAGKLLRCLVIPCFLSAGHALQAAPPKISFNRDVRPILADHCFACHGPDKNARKADLRLDSEQEATADRGGYRAIAAGKPEESELYQRITATDPARHMPPAKFGKPLS